MVWWTYGDGQYGFNITSTRSVNDGAWHFIVAERLADGTGQITIDGALDSTQSAPSRTLGSGFNVYVGADIRNVAFGDSPSYFNGLIDQVDLFNRALTSTEIQALYAANGLPAVVESGYLATDQRGLARVYNGGYADIQLGPSRRSANDVVSSASDSGPGSLRQAVAGTTSAGLRSLDRVLHRPSTGQTITLTSEARSRSDQDLTIGDGPGAEPLDDQRRDGFSALHHRRRRAVTISGLTPSPAAVDFRPGGRHLQHAGTLSVSDAIFSNDVVEGFNNAPIGFHLDPHHVGPWR